MGCFLKQKSSLKLTANAPEDGGPLEVWRFLLETIIFRGFSLLVSGSVYSMHQLLMMNFWNDRISIHQALHVNLSQTSLILW